MVKRTRAPFWQAASPNANARCVLPVPELPNAHTFSRRSRYSERASASTRLLFTDGIARNSQVSRLFKTGNLAAFAPLGGALLAIEQLQLAES